jgi:regulation of enolase protein 1 (concanavalin A-like superfamily)
VAFHASTDGEWWQLVRYFAFDPEARIGVLAQSPTGDGVTVSFSELSLTGGRLAGLRDGS